MLFDAEELTLTHDVANTGHTHPSPTDSRNISQMKAG
jgi:hypothetical protein